MKNKDNPEYQIVINREKEDRNTGCYMTIDGKEFDWHDSTEEDRHIFREMLVGFANLFNKC
jgi:hypothetical protein